MYHSHQSTGSDYTQAGMYVFDLYSTFRLSCDRSVVAARGTFIADEVKFVHCRKRNGSALALMG